MSVAVLDLGLVVDRLQAACTLFRDVGDSASFARLQPKTIPFPSAYVIPLADRAGENRYAGCGQVTQPVTIRFGVIMAARDIRPDRGAQALSEIGEARRAVRSALVGWMPADATETCRFVQGQLVSGLSTEGGMLWQDDFTTKMDLRSIP